MNKMEATDLKSERAKEDMDIIEVNSSSVLNELYEGWAFTVEGLHPDAWEELFNWIEQYTPVKSRRLYVISGSYMNKAYGLTGTNAYDDSIYICCVKLADIEDADKLAYPRFEIGGRWFTDVVENNARRQNEEVYCSDYEDEEIYSEDF